MKATLSAVGIFAAGTLLGFYLGQKSVSLPNTGIVEKPSSHQSTTAPAKDTAPIIPTSLSDKEGQIYSRLGLQNEDTVFEINDAKVPQGFALLVSGYDSGNLCIKYERSKQLRKVCYLRNADGEKVMDLAVQ